MVLGPPRRSYCVLYAEEYVIIMYTMYSRRYIDGHRGASVAVWDSPSQWVLSLC